MSESENENENLSLNAASFEFSKVFLTAQEAYLPEKRVSSNEIEEELKELYDRLKLPFGRLELMTGIKERRMFSEEDKPSQMAIRAAEKLFEKNNDLIKREDIDLLIFGSVCRDFLEPATAALVHYGLKLSPHCAFFDLSNACLGIVHAWNLAAHLIEKGLIRNALVVGAENGAPLLNSTLKKLLTDKSIDRKNIKKYFANFTIGCGAYASLLQGPSENISTGKSCFKLGKGHFLSDTRASSLCSGGSDGQGGLMMETDSEALLNVGIELAKNNWKALSSSLGSASESQGEGARPYYIAHQVGTAHENLLFSSLNISLERVHRTYPFLGNTGSCALPLTLWDLQSKERSLSLKQGDKVILLGIGSGLSSFMWETQWIC